MGLGLHEAGGGPGPPVCSSSRSRGLDHVTVRSGPEGSRAPSSAQAEAGTAASPGILSPVNCPIFSARVLIPVSSAPRAARLPAGSISSCDRVSCVMGTAPLNPDLRSSRPPIVAPDHVTGKRCFQTTNGYLSDSRSCSSNYNVAALATSSLVGVVQSIKDHITKPTAMARGRVAHLIEWKGWSAQRSGWELSPAEDEHYCCLPDEVREARFAAGVAEQFAITEATLSAWSSLDDEELHPEDNPQDVIQLQGTARVGHQGRDDSLLAFSSPGLSPDGWPSPEEPPFTAASSQPPSPEQQHRQRLPGAPGPEAGACLQGSLPSVDSGSLSEEEDEVFYN
ncbi:hypothetical protein CB1_001086017 [Camelus ferus]|nr:hypothetical protein CB1_001086017 [Camelus ferus]